MAGRRPKPTALKLVTGNPGKRKLNQDEPQPPKVVPSCPPHIKGEAKQEWERVVVILEGMSLMTEVDRAALAVYCQSYARWVEAENQLSGEPMVVEGSQGNKIINPLVRIIAESMKQMIAAGNEFGMTPSSRSRVHVGSGKDKKEDKAESYFNKKTK